MVRVRLQETALRWLCRPPKMLCSIDRSALSFRCLQKPKGSLSCYDRNGRAGQAGCMQHHHAGWYRSNHDRHSTGNSVQIIRPRGKDSQARGPSRRRRARDTDAAETLRQHKDANDRHVDLQTTFNAAFDLAQKLVRAQRDEVLTLRSEFAKSCGLTTKSLARFAERLWPRLPESNSRFGAWKFIDSGSSL